MKWAIYVRKRILAVSLVGAAAAIMAAMPYGMASAADAETGPSVPPPRMERRMGPGPAVSPQAKLAFSHRVQQMVRDGKLTSDQALKLNKEMQRFQKKQRKERRQFMESLSDRTGIDQDTLKEIFAPPQRNHMMKHHDTEDWDN